MSFFIFAALSLLAAAFVVWPLVFSQRYGQQYSAQAPLQDTTQAALYQEHLTDLDRALATGEMPSEHYPLLKLELQRTFLDEAKQVKTIAPNAVAGKTLLMLAVLLVPLMGFGLYHHWGAFEEWQLTQQLKAQRAINPDDENAYKQATTALIDNIKNYVQRHPKSPQWLYMLASYSSSTQDIVAAEQYYRQVLALEPRSPVIMAELAQILFIRSNNVVTPEIQTFIQDALKLAPNLPAALSLGGIAGFQGGRYQEAIDYWSRALQVLDPQSGGYQALQGGIAKAKQALGEQAPATAPADAASSLAIEVQVSLAPGVTASSEDAVFVYARAWQGAKMPLAIQRFTVADLPKTLRLDKSMAMAPGMDITSAPQLEIIARVSKKGSATAASGDWQASEGPVTLDTLKAPITLVIATQLP